MADIILFKGVFAHDVVNNFIDDMNQTFMDMGLKTVVLFVKNGHSLEERKVRDILLSELNEKTQFVFSANLTYYEYFMEVVKDYDKYTFVSLLVDTPFIHYGRLKIIRDGRNLILASIDENHLAITKFYSNHVLFMPHGGNELKKEEIPFEDRKIDVFFAGGYEDPIKKYQTWKEEFSEERQALMNKMLLTVTEKSDIYLENIIGSTAKSRKDLERILDSGIENSFLEVDDFIRKSRRHKLIKHMLDSGSKVVCAGHGWEEFGDDRLICIGELTYKETLEKMAESKVVLNASPSYKRGGHERIFSTMLNHSVCFTEANSYLQKRFEDEESILFFNYDSLDQDIKKVKHAITDKTYWQAISRNGYALASLNHTWKNRSEQLLAYVRARKLQQEVKGLK